MLGRTAATVGRERRRNATRSCATRVFDGKSLKFEMNVGHWPEPPFVPAIDCVLRASSHESWKGRARHEVMEQSSSCLHCPCQHIAHIAVPDSFASLEQPCKFIGRQRGFDTGPGLDLQPRQGRELG